MDALASHAGVATGAASPLPVPPARYRPPAPQPTGPLRALLRVVLNGERNLLSLLPAPAYHMKIGRLGWSRRGIVLVNDPVLVSEVLRDETQMYPKNDLMVDALQALVGDSMFVCSGARWQRQRSMIEPAFALMRIDRVFDLMVQAVDAQVDELESTAAAQGSITLDAMLSRLTADIVCRALFSVPLSSASARSVFEDFLLFEQACASVDVGRLLFGRPWAGSPQGPQVTQACQRIRAQIGTLLDQHQHQHQHAALQTASPPDLPEMPGSGASGGPTASPDIAQMLVDARDPVSGAGFSREELIDQLGVFFLAGHETTASALTWAFFVLAMQPALVRRLRDEVAQMRSQCPGAPDAAAFRQLGFTRNVFREALRLYPPITFLPRVALRDGQLGPCRIRRGNMVMIAPWTLHRHAGLWRDPECFDPDRFVGGLDRAHAAGAYIPFGQGPRVCVGAAFATLEATLILARLVERFDFVVEQPERVRPAARLTTRPEHEIRVQVRARPAPP